MTTSGLSFLDETEWALTGASAATVVSGGPYGFGSTNTTTRTITAGLPLTFDINTQGFFNDHIATFSIECAGAVVASSTSWGAVYGGPNMVQVSNICCSAP